MGRGTSAVLINSLIYMVCMADERAGLEEVEPWAQGLLDSLQ